MSERGAGGGDRGSGDDRGRAREARAARLLGDAVDARLTGVPTTAAEVGAAAHDALPDEAADAEVSALLGVANLVRDGLRPPELDELTRRRLRRALAAAADESISADAREREGVARDEARGGMGGSAPGEGAGSLAPRRVRARFWAGIAALAAVALLAVSATSLLLLAPAGKSAEPAGGPVSKNAAESLHDTLVAATPRYPAPPDPRALWAPSERPADRLDEVLRYGVSTLREDEFQAMRRLYLARGGAEADPARWGHGPALAAARSTGPSGRPASSGSIGSSLAVVALVQR
jgi:hypothetical protein